jgi:hypothetical protein
MAARTEQAYQQRIADLEKKVAELTATVARLLKNSSDSSKPPSSDIVKPPKPSGPKGGKCRIGGQQGHPRHQRPPFTPEQIGRQPPRGRTSTSISSSFSRTFPYTKPLGFVHAIEQSLYLHRPSLRVLVSLSIPMYRELGQMLYRPLSLASSSWLRVESTRLVKRRQALRERNLAILELYYLFRPHAI